MSRIPPISEENMLAAEAQFPALAERAGRAAHERGLALTGRVVMRSAQGQLVEAHADGSVRVLGKLPPPTPARAGTVLKRKTPEPSAR